MSDNSETPTDPAASTETPPPAAAPARPTPTTPAAPRPPTTRRSAASPTTSCPRTSSPARTTRSPSRWTPTTRRPRAARSWRWTPPRTTGNDDGAAGRRTAGGQRDGWRGGAVAMTPDLPACHPREGVVPPNVTGASGSIRNRRPLRRLACPGQRPRRRDPDRDRHGRRGGHHRLVRRGGRGRPRHRHADPGGPARQAAYVPARSWLPARGQAGDPHPSGARRCPRRPDAYGVRVGRGPRRQGPCRPRQPDLRRGPPRRRARREGLGRRPAHRGRRGRVPRRRRRPRRPPA